MDGSKRKTLAWAAVLACLFVASSGVAVSHVEVYGPQTVADSLALLAKLGLEAVFDPAALQSQTAEMNAIPGFYEVRTRLLVSILTACCGALLAIAGSLYQWVFRNPVAAPTMLGVSNGVSIGVFALVMQFGSAAVFMTAERYLYCFAGALAVLALVASTTFLAGGRRGFSVVVMLVVGSIVSQIAGAIVGYLTAILMDDSALIAYQNILQVIDVAVEPVTFAVLGATALIGIAPVVVLRFSLNALALDEDEIRAFGLSQTALRIVALSLGTIMIVSCEVLVGTVSMVSLFVPFISRAVFGAEFGRQLVGNTLIGASVLLLCRTVADLIPFVGDGFPLGVVVSFVALPFFVAVVVRQQRTWE